MTVAHVLAAVGCIAVLSWCLYVLALGAVDGHRRGMARVHRGTSWTPKVTSSHDEQAAA